MRIVAAEVERMTLRLRRPLVTAQGAIAVRAGFVLRLTSAAGLVGEGEASPAYWIGEGSLADTEARLRALVATIAAERPDVDALRTRFLDDVPNEPRSTAAACALDTALLDLAARARGVGLAGLLGGAAAREVAVAALIGGTTDDELRRAVDDAVSYGVRTLKMKVGGEPLDVDLRRVAAVRGRAGNGIALRLDANRAWDYDHARTALAAFAPFAPDYVEEPLRGSDPAVLARLAGVTGVALAVDESVGGGDDLERVIAAGVSLHVVLKAARVGGPTRLLALARRAVAAGFPVVVTDAIEGPVGTSVAVHLAAALPEPVPAVGLGGLMLGDGAPCARCAAVGPGLTIAVAGPRSNMRPMGEALPVGCGPWLGERARSDGAALALVAGDERCSWEELAARVEVIAGRLAALGLAPGARLAVVMEPSRRLVELIHAAQRCRVALVLVNPRLTAPELAGILAHAAPALVLHDAVAHAVAAGARSVVNARAAGLDTGAAGREAGAAIVQDGGETVVLEADAGLDAVTPIAPVARARVDPADVQTILYTSGTTGTPKGVMLTHGNQRASASASRARLGARPDDRWLSALPLHHVGGLALVMRSVLDGTPLVLHARFDAAAVWETVGAERITLLSLVPTMLRRLLDVRGERPAGTALRVVLVGGAALAPDLYGRASAAGLPIVPTYGLTEAASQVATAAVGAGVTDAVGPPLAGTQVRIDGADATGCGEILVAGPTVMAGYLRAVDATAAVLRDGWLRTGDVGRLDAHGHLQVFDRRVDVVISGGENVYPTEVEDVLLGHAAIAEAAVYGVPDDEWGRCVAAAVVLVPGSALDAAALRGWCRERLAAYKIPRTIVCVERLPRTAAGKLQRHLLAPDTPATDIRATIPAIPTETRSVRRGSALSETAGGRER